MVGEEARPDLRMGLLVYSRIRIEDVTFLLIGDDERNTISIFSVILLESR